MKFFKILLVLILAFVSDYNPKAISYYQLNRKIVNRGYFVGKKLNTNQYLGFKYRYGANNKPYFDCSSFVKYVYLKEYNIELPRTSLKQSLEGTQVLKDSLKVGDLVFFYKPIKHVAIYIGGNQILHCIKKGSIVEPLNFKYFNKAVRIIQTPHNK